jgi:hypothetical protein
MVRLVPAHVHDGSVTPLTPLPERVKIRSAFILLELDDNPSEPEPARFSRWFGILKDYTGDPKADYRKHLEEKYLK